MSIPFVVTRADLRWELEQLVATASIEVNGKYAPF
jgi:hypothetical protein